MNRVGSRGAVLFRQPIQPLPDLRPNLGGSRAAQKTLDGCCAPAGQGQKRWRAVQRAVSKPHRIFAQFAQERIRQMGQGFHPRQITLRGFRPGGQLAGKARHPVRTVFPGGVRPAPDILQLLHRVYGKPEPRDQVAFHFAMKQPAQRTQGHTHRRIRSANSFEGRNDIRQASQAGRPHHRGAKHIVETLLNDPQSGQQVAAIDG